MPVIPVSCAHCQTVFSVEPWRRKTARFCSTSCHDDYRAAQSLLAFWDKIQHCEHEWMCFYCCWLWKKATTGTYPVTTVHNRSVGAHRLAWELWHKRPFPSDLGAAHYCHNPLCCNPMHIHPATQQVNIADSIRDGRTLRGENHANSKLTDEKVQQAFLLHNQGVPMVEIAQQRDISTSAVGLVLHRQTWTHVQIAPSLSSLPLLPGCSQGEAHPQAKLSAHDIRDIMALRQAGMTHRAIAQRYHVDRTTIGKLLAGDTWKHRDTSSEDT